MRFLNRGTKDSYFIDTMHLSEKGNQHVGQFTRWAIAPESNRHYSNSDL